MRAPVLSVKRERGRPSPRLVLPTMQLEQQIVREERTMAERINRAIELLASGQPIYYVGAHTRHVLTHG
jgi:hypothetical protein